MITGKDYLETLRIQDEAIYDNVEGMHSLECLLDDFLKENQAKHNEVLGDVSNCPTQKHEAYKKYDDDKYCKDCWQKL